MKTILIAGSKNLKCNSEQERKLAYKLGNSIVTHSGWRLLTGGAVGNDTSKLEEYGIDYCAALGAKEKINDELKEKELIITLHPREKRNDLFEIGSVVKSRARTTMARRFELFSRSDIAILIEGHEGTGQLIEYFIAANKPVIPIPCTGGESKLAWTNERYRNELLQLLNISEGSIELSVLENGINTIDVLCKICIEIIENQLKPTCFVMMPFRLAHSNQLWNEILKPIIENAGFIPIRADESHSLGQIIEDITSKIKESDIIIGDLTGMNPNVLYEIGYAHALNKKTILLYCLGKEKNWTKDLPFDIRGLRIFTIDFSIMDKSKKELTNIIKLNNENMFRE